MHILGGLPVKRMQDSSVWVNTDLSFLRSAYLATLPCVRCAHLVRVGGEPSWIRSASRRSVQSGSPARLGRGMGKMLRV